MIKIIEDAITKFKSARKGEEVRNALVDVAEFAFAYSMKAITFGTEISENETVATSDYFDGMGYLNTETGDLFKVEGGKWIKKGNLSGKDGDSITGTSENVEGGVKVTLSNKDTEEVIDTFILFNGQNGASLTVEHSKSGLVTTVTIKNAETGAVIDTFEINDGQSGSGTGDMLESDYVGESATKSVHKADSASSADSVEWKNVKNVPEFATSWDKLEGKPFKSIDGETVWVDENGVLHAEGGGSVSSILNITTNTESWVGKTVTATSQMETVSGVFGEDKKCMLKLKYIDKYIITCERERLELDVDAVGKIYNIEMNEHFAMIDVSTTTLVGETVKLFFNGEEVDSAVFTSNSVRFKVYDLGEYTMKVDYQGRTLTNTVNVSALDQTFSTSIDNHFSTINVTTSTLNGYEVKAYLGAELKASATFANGSASLTVIDTGTYKLKTVFANHEYTVDVNVSALDQTYTAVLNEVHATIEVTTTTDEWKNSSVSLSLSGGVVQTGTLANGRYVFTVYDLGTYTVTLQEKTKEVVVTDWTAYELIIDNILDGATAEPTNNVQTWIECTMVSKQYTTLEEVIADTTALNQLISDENACNYLVRSTGFASQLCANQTAMTYIGLNDYCSNLLFSDVVWRNAICNSAYFESVLNVKVPTMTSNTEPYGEVFASDYYIYENIVKYPYYAFNGNVNDSWVCNNNNNTNQYIGYMFNEPVCIKNVSFLQHGDMGYMRCKDFEIQASNDGKNYDTLYSGIAINTTDIQTIKTENSNSYKYYRFFIKNTYNTDNSGAGLKYLQFFGR